MAHILPSLALLLMLLLMQTGMQLVFAARVQC